MSKDKAAPAITTKAHKLSKGQRNSGGRVHRPAANQVEGDLNNQIRNAFLDTDFPDSIRFSRLGNLVIKSVQQEQRLTADQRKGHSYNLSFRTFKTLQAQGRI